MGEDGSAGGGPTANKVQSKCLCCGDIFTVDVRNRGRQKYCRKPPRRAAGKAAQQRRWLGKPENRDYFRGPEHVERVRVWRAEHPGYWRSHRRGHRVALQDALRSQGPVLIGLIAHLSDSAATRGHRQHDPAVARTRAGHPLESDLSCLANAYCALIGCDGCRRSAIFLGGVGLGKTHLGIALGHAARTRLYRTLHHRHRHHPHPLGRGSHRRPQARHAALCETPTAHR